MLHTIVIITIIPLKLLLSNYGSLVAASYSASAPTPTDSVSEVSLMASIREVSADSTDILLRDSIN